MYDALEQLNKKREAAAIAGRPNAKRVAKIRKNAAQPRGGQNHRRTQRLSGKAETAIGEILSVPDTRPKQPAHVPMPEAHRIIWGHNRKK